MKLFKFLLILVFMHGAAQAQVSTLFTNVTANSPLTGNKHIIQVLDIDNDLDDDLLVHVNWFNGSYTTPALSGYQLWRNNGGGSYTQVTSNGGLQFLHTLYMTFNGDFDNNGFQDLVLMGQDSISIFLNSNGFFTDVTTKAGFPNRSLTSKLALDINTVGAKKFADVNNDGLLDLAVVGGKGNQSFVFALIASSQCAGTGLSYDSTVTLMSSSILLEGMNFADIDNDFDQDLLLSEFPLPRRSPDNHYYDQNYKVYLNNNGSFVLNNATGFNAGRISSFGQSADLNNDGRTDLISGSSDCCEAGNPLRVWYSGTALPLTMNPTAIQRKGNPYYGGALPIDLDLDGWDDVMWTNLAAVGGTQGAKLQFFKNNKNNTFTENAAGYGINLGSTGNCCPITVSTSSAIFDYNNDGREDVYIESIPNAASTLSQQGRWLMQNTLTSNYVNIKLQACKGVRDGSGAKIKYKIGGVWFNKHVDYTSRQTSPYSEMINLGLSANQVIDSLVVNWVGGAQTVRLNVGANQTIVIEENSGCVRLSKAADFNPFQDTVRLSNEDSIVLDAGSGFKKYRWNTIDSTSKLVVKNSGKYVVNVETASGCFYTDSVFVSMLSARILQNDTTFCVSDSIELSVVSNDVGISQTGIIPGNLKDKLLAWYPFNGNINDESGNARNATLSAGVLKFVTNSSGYPGKALEFDGATSLKIPHNSAFNAFPMTLSAWFKTKDAEPGHLINKYENATWNGWSLSVEPKGTGHLLRNYSNSMISGYGNYPPFETIQPMNEGVWHNLTFVVDSASGRIYRDGLLEDTQLWRGTPGPPSSAWPLYIGYYATSYQSIGNADPFFDGTIDDIAIWGKALNANEVKQLSGSSLSLKYKWSTGDTTTSIKVKPSITTTYYVTITDGINSVLDSVKINVFDKGFNPLQDTIKLTNVDSTILNAGAGYSKYKWNTLDSTSTIVVKNPGKYTVTVENASGCTGFDSTFISIVKLKILTADTTICANTSIQIKVDTLLRTNYKVGDFGPSGGYVFYDKGDNLGGWRFLEISPSDVDSNYGMGAYCVVMPNTSNSVGSGFTNTQNWINNNGSGFVTTAKNFKLKGYGNWFIPSKDELNLIFTNLKQKGIGNLRDAQYWSSSPAPYGSCGINGGASVQNFGNGTQYGDYRPGYQGAGLLRLARAFSNGEKIRYLWSTGDTTANITVKPAKTTKYFVTVSDGVTSVKDSVTVSVFGDGFNPFSDTLRLANVDSVILKTGSGYKKYKWNTGDTTSSLIVRNTGKYSVVVENTAGCIATDSSYVSIVKVNIINTDTTICAGTSINITTAGQLKASYKIGDVGPAGGTIFYDKGFYSDGWRFMEYANVDLSQYGQRWGSDTLTIGTDSIIGSGYSNSLKIQDQLVKNTAASLALSYIQNGYDDWFLPSKNELHQIYLNIGNKQPNINYWSSTDYNKTNAWYENINAGYEFPINVFSKNALGFSVRAVRYVTGLPNFKYLWSTSDTTANISVTPLIKTTYYVTASDGVSVAKDSVTINVFGTGFNPLADTLKTSAGSLVLNAGNGYAKYRWNTGDTTSSIVAKQSGKYKVTVFNASGCSVSDSSYLDFLVADILQKDTTICKADSILLALKPQKGARLLDIDGNSYGTVKIGSQIWMNSDLKTTRYSNGDSIVDGQNLNKWYTAANNNIGAYSIYNNDTSYANQRGKIYNGYVAIDNRNSCPVGWKVPTDNDFSIMESFIGLPAEQLNILGARGTNQQVGVKLKSKGIVQYGTGLWDLSGTSQGTDIYGWNGYPHGARLSGGDFCCGNGSVGYLVLDSTKKGVIRRELSFNVDGIIRFGEPLLNGHQIRCLKDTILSGNVVKYKWSTGDTTEFIKVKPTVSTTYKVTVSNGISSYGDSVTIYVNGSNFNPFPDTTNECAVSKKLIADTGYASYLWNTGETTQAITASQTGWYKLKVVTSQSCEFYDSTYLVLSSQVLSTINIPDTVSACGLNTQLDAGQGFTSFKWSTGDATRSITVNQSGNYFLTVSNAQGCTASKNIYVSLVNANIIQNDTSICKNTSIVLSASTDGQLGNSASSVMTSDQLKNGLVGWYPFNGNANDESGNNRNGVVKGANLTADRFGVSNKAYSFRTNQEINVPNTSSMNIFPFSVSLWYNIDTISGLYDEANIFTKYSPAAWNGYAVVTANMAPEQGNVYYPTVKSWYLKSYNDRLIGRYGSAPFEHGNLTQKRWYHMVFTVSPDSGKIYVDGNLLSVDKWDGKSGASSNTFNWKIGGKYDRWFNGQIDDIAIYNRALSSSDIKALYGLVPSKKLTYKWSTGDTTALINVKPTQTTRYYVTVSDGITSCIDSVLVTIKSADTSLTVLDPQTVCSSGNSTVRLQAANSSSYKWLKDGVIIPGATSSLYTATQTGSYRSILTGTNGCIDTTRSVVINPADEPSADFSIANASQCITSNLFAFTNKSSINIGNITYRWDFGDGTNSTIASPSKSYTSSGTYTVKLFATSDRQCSDTMSQQAFVFPVSVAGTISGAGTVCSGTNQKTLTLSGYTGNVQWQSSADNVNFNDIANAISPTYRLSNITVSTYYRAVVSSEVCAPSISSSVQVTVIPLPVAPIATNASRCGTGTVLLSATAPAGSVVDWYADSLTSTLLTGGSGVSSFTTPSISGTTNFYMASRNTTTGCVSAIRVAVTATVNPASSAGVVATPSGSSVCIGTNSKDLVVYGNVGTIQWQSSADNVNFANINGATSNTYTATNLAVTNYFRVIAINGSCAPDTSRSASITVYQPTVAGTVTGAASVCIGVNSTILGLTGNLGTTFQWQSSTDNTNFVNITGAISSTYTATNLTAATNYRAIVTNGACASATTASAAITINPSPSAPLAGNATRCGTGSVVLTATPPSGSVIDWYAASTGGTVLTGGSGVSSFTTPSISVTTTYYVEARNSVTGCKSMTRTAVVATVDPVSVAGIISGDATVCSGTNSSLLVLGGNIGTVQWQSSTNNVSFTNINGANSQAYTATNLNATTYYRAVVTSGACSAANTSSSTITVNPASVAGSISGAATVCSGTNSTLLTLSGNTGTIQWQRSTNNAAFTNINGATAQTYTVSNLTATTYYRAFVTSGACASANTASATITVNPTSVAGTISGATTICSGTNSTVLTLSGNTGAIQWQSSANNVNFTNINGASAQTYTATNLNSTTYYRAVVTSGVCAAATTASATITVNPASVAGTVSGAATVCTGTNSTVLTLGGNTGTIQWQSSINNTNFTNINGATSQTYTATNLNATTYYRAVVTSGVCAAATTASATITVNPTSVAGTVSGAATVCTSTNSTVLTLSGNTGSIQWQSSSNNTNFTNINGATGQTYNATNLTATTYYRAVVTSGVCAAATTASSTVTVNPASVAGTISGTATVCSGTNNTTLTLSGNMGAVQWQSSSDTTNFINIIGATAQTYTATNLNSTTYYRAVVTSGVCTAANTASATITVNPTPVAGTVSGAGTVCSGSNSATLTLSGNTGTIQWQSSSNNTNFTNINGATTQTYTATNLTATTYYRAVVTNGSCVAITSSSTITVNPLPVLSTSGTVAAVCFSTANQSTTLPYLSSNSPVSYSIDWSATANQAGLLDQSTTAFVFAAGAGTVTGIVIPGSTAAGTYAGVISIASSNGCVSTSNISITINALPAVPVISTASNNLCIGSSLVLSTNGSASLQWYRNNVAITNATSSTLTVSQSGDYKVVSTSIAGCVRSSLVSSITSSAVPVAGFSVNKSNQCLKDNSFEFINESKLDTGKLSYSWTFGDGDTSVLLSPIKSFKTAGTYNLTLVVKSDKGCESRINQSVTVYDQPIEPDLISTDSSLCTGRSLLLTTNGDQFLQWYKDSVLLVGSTSSSLLVNKGGKYRVQNRDNNGCVSESVLQLIVENPMPMAGFTLNNAVQCFDENRIITTNSSKISSGLMSYEWSFGDSTYSSALNPIHSYKKPGIYRVWLKVSGVGGCSDSMNRVVTIKDLPIKPNVNVVGNTVLCEGGRVFLIADDQFKYQWYRNGSPIVADTNKVLRVEVGGIYQVRGYSAQGCYSGLSDALKLVVGVSPSVPEVKDLMYCINALSKPLTAQGTVGNALLWYTPLTGDTAKLIAPVPSTSRIGNFEYYVSQRNAEGCEGEKVKLVVRVGSIVRKPEIKWDGGFLSTDAGYESYAWSADNKLVETNTLGIHKPKVGGSYRVKVSNQFGCVDSSAVYVLVVTGVSNATVDNTIKMKVYPNPSQSKVWIDIGERPSKEVTLRLLDLKGRVVYQTKTKQQTTMINWSGMVSGTYMVEAVNGTSRKTMKVLKE